jgi:CubicO group peptidase (beta-lactamase class C family)
MTVRDLLTHRVGLERGDQLWYATTLDRDDILRRIRYLPPSSSVRSKFGYQNIMFLAAGQVVKSVSGQAWDDFVRQRIFVPLGMSDTGTSRFPIETSTTSRRPVRSTRTSWTWRSGFACTS